MTDWKKVETAPAWKPEKPGDEIVGLYVSMEDQVGPNGSNLYTLELDDNSQLGVWGSAVLDSRFKQIPVGNEVKIVYLGKEKSEQRKGAEYKNYEVYSRMPEITGSDELKKAVS